MSSPQLSRYLLPFAMVLIKFYRGAISPYLKPRCRFLPTCSSYALEALQGHGLVKGGKLTLKRLYRCHPWGGSGLDPVPTPTAKEWTQE